MKLALVLTFWAAVALVLWWYTPEQHPPAVDITKCAGVPCEELAFDPGLFDPSRLWGGTGQTFRLEGPGTLELVDVQPSSFVVYGFAIQLQGDGEWVALIQGVGAGCHTNPTVLLRFALRAKGDGAIDPGGEDAQAPLLKIPAYTALCVQSTAAALGAVLLKPWPEAVQLR